MVYPLGDNSTRRTISSGFGDRHDVPNVSDIHRGVDIPAPRTTQLYSIGDGTVVRARTETGDASSLGIHVVIELDYVHTRPNGTKVKLRIGYAHLDTRGVNEGQRVTAGQPIGTVGDRGSPGNFHLHLQAITCGTTVFANNDYSNTINPLRFFPHITNFVPNSNLANRPNGWCTTRIRRHQVSGGTVNYVLQTHNT
jgi:murein DD-endopeptidase MepM/ murein hydrolase activator NlpD